MPTIQAYGLECDARADQTGIVVQMGYNGQQRLYDGLHKYMREPR